MIKPTKRTREACKALAESDSYFLLVPDKEKEGHLLSYFVVKDKETEALFWQGLVEMTFLKE